MTAINKKTFKELSEIYHQITVELRIGNHNNDENTFHFEPVITYASAMYDEVDNSNPNLKLRLLRVKASLFYDEARILLLRHNIPVALDTLKRALCLLEGHKLDPSVTYLYFRISNQLAYYLTKHDDLDAGLVILEKVEKIYKSLENTFDIEIFDTEDLFQDMCLNKKKIYMKFEKLVNNNFQLQAWIYNKKHLTDKFIIYHHLILRRQLETQDGNALSWVFKCARLGSYFFGMHRFTEARHHLAAACHILREYEFDLLKHRSESFFAAEWNNLQKYYADMGKFWVKYGLFLFEASRRFVCSVSSSDASVNDILIKSFNETNSRKPFQIARNSSREKLETIHENPDEASAEFASEPDLPRNNESVESLTFNKEKFVKFNSHLIEQNIEAHKDDSVATSSSSQYEENISSYSGVIEIAEGEENKDETYGSQKSVIVEEVVEISKSVLEVLDFKMKEAEDMKKQVETTDGEQTNTNVDADNQEPGISNIEGPLEQTQEDNKENVDINKVQQNIIENLSLLIDENKTDSEKLENTDEDSNYVFTFPSLAVQDIEAKVSDEWATSLEAARALFLHSQEWLSRSKGFYNIQDYPIDYINLILDLNELFRYLSLYETSIDTQYDLQKRRVDLLEKLTALLKEYRPQYYLSLHIELINELTQAQIELLAINLRRLGNVPSQTLGIKLLDANQQKEEAVRRMEALVDIRKRLTRKESTNSSIGMRVSFPEMQQFR